MFRKYTVRGRFWIFGVLLGISAFNMIAYNIQIVHTVGYIKYMAIELNVKFIFISLITIAGVTFLLPKTIRMPSDFFRLSYSFLVLLFFGVFHTSAYNISFEKYMSYLVLLTIPLVALKVFSYVKVRINLRKIVRIETIQWLVLSLCLVTLLLSLLNTTASAGFSLETVYSRRLEGRDIYKDSTLLSYLTSISINGLIPFLAFRAGLKKNHTLLLYCLMFDMSFFYVLGLKGPIFHTILGYGVGAANRKNDAQLIYKMILLSFVGLFVIFVLERVLFDFSFTAELILRRAFIVPTFVIMQYFDLMFGDTYLGWSALNGVFSDKGVSYLVGDVQFSHAATNAGTNAFVSALAAGGFVGYIVANILVAGLLRLLDILYFSCGNKAYLFIGFSFSIMVIAQAATTAFISSGVGVLLVLVSLTGDGMDVKDIKKRHSN